MKNNKKYLLLFSCIVLLGLIVASCTKEHKGTDGLDDQVPPEELEVKVHKVWDEGTSADVIWFKNAFYCTFREDSEDPHSKGRVRVVKSDDGVLWETVQVFEFTDLPTPTEPTDYLAFNMPYPAGGPAANVAQSMTIPHHQDFDFTMTDVFSLSAWVWREYKTDPSEVSGANNDGAIVSTRHANAALGYVFQNRPNIFMLDFGTTTANGGTNYRRHNQGNFRFHEWEHIGFVYDGPGGTARLYINGTEGGLISGQTNILRSNGNDVNTVGNDIAVFGSARSGSGNIPTVVTPGRIRTLRFWNKAMSAADMTADMTATVNASTPNLIAGYDFASQYLTWNEPNWLVPDVKGSHPGILNNFSFALYGIPSADLQAPKLSIAPGNRLMLQMYGEYDRADGSLAYRRPYISFSDDGGTFSDMVPSEVYDADNALSNGDFRISGVTWDQTTLGAYGFDYTNPLTLFKTANGTTFRAQAVLTELNANLGDVQVRFDKRNKMYVLIKKDEGDQHSILAVSAAPYTSFDYYPLDFRVHSPHFIIRDDTLVMGAQDTDNPAMLRIIVADLEGKIIKEIPVALDGGIGDPGGIVVHDKYLWLSYTHLLNGKSEIGMVKVPLDDLKL